MEGTEYGTEDGEGEMGMEARRWRRVLLSLSYAASAQIMTTRIHVHGTNS